MAEILLGLVLLSVLRSFFIIFCWAVGAAIGISIAIPVCVCSAIASAFSTRPRCLRDVWPRRESRIMGAGYAAWRMCRSVAETNSWAFHRLIEATKSNPYLLIPVYITSVPLGVVVYLAVHLLRNTPQ